MIATRETERATLAEIRSLSEVFEEIGPEECRERADLLGLRIVPIRAWKSRRFVVQLYEPANGGQRISVRRSTANAMIRPKNRDTRPISWDELMAVKRLVGFGDRWAVEVYPPDAGVMDVAPMRHLFLCDRPEFAW